MDVMTRVEVHEQGRTTVARLTGELTAPDIPRLESHLVSLERTPGLAYLFVDLTALEFIDSSGIALLLRFKRRGAQSDYEFAVRGLSRIVRDRLDRSGLLSILLGADDVAPSPGARPTETTPNHSDGPLP